MSQHTLSDVAAHIREQAITYCESSKVPGYLAGVYQAGEQTVISHGVANITAQALMRDDTGFLYGSITKVLTTTLVLQQVERGVIDLDDRVVNYLPEFKLATPEAAEKIRVRHLLSHTNGIDADLFLVDANGGAALKVYLAQLGQSCGALFEPDEYVSYSNGGMMVAGRMLEVVTGTSYHDLLERELYSTVGMNDSCTSAEKAILRSTAVGHFPDPASNSVRRTDMFMLPDSWAPAGSTPIGTIHDLLAFARTHLANGVAPSGAHVLSHESVARMQLVSHDMGTPNVSPIGFGWLLVPFGKTTVLSMSGASPGGVAVLALVPEHDLAFAAFGNSPMAMPLHDQILLWLLNEHLAVEVPNLVSGGSANSDLTPYAGTYRSNQLRVDVNVVDGQLEEKVTYEPLNAAQQRIFSGFAGGSSPFPPRRFVPVGADIFAPVGVPLQAFNGYSRQLLVSYHGLSNGRAEYRCAGGRMTRRVPASITSSSAPC
ncbi:MAG: beta-lactamase family protein [Chloroflexi bacterium]|nr:beta-lactamase family protein [Chloroflexota bacterium]MBV9895523.1 beta-lactamase family protein [Chloroflexota bacterium]